MQQQVLDIELKRLKNQIFHLERSCQELKDALATNPDTEYRTALNENIVLIAKQRARLASLEQQKQEALCALPQPDLQQQQERLQQQRQQIQLQVLQLQRQAEQQQQQQQQPQQPQQPAVTDASESMETESRSPQAEGQPVEGGSARAPPQAGTSRETGQAGHQQGSTEDGVWL